jgi:hypothetical protein
MRSSLESRLTKSLLISLLQKQELSRNTWPLRVTVLTSARTSTFWIPTLRVQQVVPLLQLQRLLLQNPHLLLLLLQPPNLLQLQLKRQLLHLHHQELPLLKPQLEGDLNRLLLRKRQLLLVEPEPRQEFQ